MCIRDRLQVLPLVNTTFAIPAGAKTHEVTANFNIPVFLSCLLYTSDAADERSSVDLGGRRIIKKKKTWKQREENILT